MKVRTEIRQEVVVKTTKSHTAMIEFDTMLLSKKRYSQLVAKQVLSGEEAGFALESSKYLDDDRAVLKLNGKQIAIVELED